jgi:hypothetical protein
MKEKAARMTQADPHKKVDASSWEPREMMNTEAKTGLRPLTKRQYKRGGKVNVKAEGEKAVKHAGRKARKDGGRAGSKPITANTYVTRNVKEGNAAEHGQPHVGGYKRGGKIGYQNGGNPVADDFARIEALLAARKAEQSLNAERARTGNISTQPMKRLPASDEDMIGKRPLVDPPLPRKSGGRAGKMNGGMMMSDPRMNIVAKDRLNLSNRPPVYKKGGAVKKKAYGGGMEDDTVFPEERMAAAKVMGRRDMKTGLRPKTTKSDEDMFDEARSRIMADKYNKFKAKKDLPEQFRKAGGKVDEAQDKKLIKKAFRQHEKSEHGGKHSELKLKKGGTAKKAGGGRTPLSGHPYHSKSDAELRYISKDAAEAARNMKGVNSSAEGKYLDQMNDAQTILGHRQRTAGMTTRKPRAMTEDELMDRVEDKSGLKRGGMAMTVKGSNYTGGTRPTGGRIARATGGGLLGDLKAGKSKKSKGGKGKTNINIVIGTGRPGMDQQAPSPMMGAPRPVPVPPPAMPMPMPAPGGMPGGAPGMGAAMPPGMPGMPPHPLARKSGGKVGHRSYKSYKDMDAGAGSGFGRLEKAEIQKRK